MLTFSILYQFCNIYIKTAAILKQESIKLREDSSQGLLVAGYDRLY